jgi:hypothetical protein
MRYALLRIARRRIRAFKLPDGSQTVDRDLFEAQWRQTLVPRAAVEDAPRTRRQAVTGVVAKLRRCVNGGGSTPTPARIEYARLLNSLGLLPEDVMSDLATSGVTDEAWQLLHELEQQVGIDSPLSLLADRPEELHRAYRRATRVESGAGRDRITYPDGREVEVEPRSAAAAIDGHCRNTPPERLLRQLITGALSRQVRQQSHSRAEKAPPPPADTSCWFAELTTGEGNEQKRLWDPVEHRERVLPVNLLPEILDKLGEEGWQPVHFSEDRGIDDDASTSYLIEIRILLNRELE